MQHISQHRGSRDLTLHPKKSDKSWQSRARLRSSATGPWLILSRTFGGSGAGDRLVHTFEPNTDCGPLSCQNSASNEFCASTASTNQSDSDYLDCHEPWWQGSTVVATLVLPDHQMAKRCRPFTDEALKDTGAPSTSQRVGEIVLALAAVRHAKRRLNSMSRHRETCRTRFSSPTTQARGDRLHVPASTTNSHVTEPEASDLGGYCWMPKREPQNASSSSGRNRVP